MQVAHLASEAALTRGARQAFFDRADHTRRPVTDHQQRVRQLTPAYVVEELPAARRVLLAAGAGAVLNMMQPAAEQSIAVYGVGGVGLAGLMAARIAGCDPIIAVDRLPSRLVLPPRTRRRAYARNPPSRDARRNPQDHRRRHRFRTRGVGRAGRVSACRRRAARSRHLHPGRQRPRRHGGELRCRAAGLCAA